jgi:hypothetical protein
LIKTLIIECEKSNFDVIHRNINNLESVGITSNSNIYDNNSCFSPECSGVQVVDNGRVMNQPVVEFVSGTVHDFDG